MSKKFRGDMEMVLPIIDAYRTDLLSRARLCAPGLEVVGGDEFDVVVLVAGDFVEGDGGFSGVVFFVEGGGGFSGVALVVGGFV